MPVWKVGGRRHPCQGGRQVKLRYMHNDKEVRKNTQVVVQQMLKALALIHELIQPTGDVSSQGYARVALLATGQYDIAEWGPTGPSRTQTTALLAVQRDPQRR